jgi:hypothetical protein
VEVEVPLIQLVGVTSATAAAKIVVSIKRGYESIRIFELGMM